MALLNSIADVIAIESFLGMAIVTHATKDDLTKHQEKRMPHIEQAVGFATQADAEKFSQLTKGIIMTKPRSTSLVDADEPQPIQGETASNCYRVRQDSPGSAIAEIQAPSAREAASRWGAANTARLLSKADRDAEDVSRANSEYQAVVLVSRLGLSDIIRFTILLSRRVTVDVTMSCRECPECHSWEDIAQPQLCCEACTSKALAQELDAESMPHTPFKLNDEERAAVATEASVVKGNLGRILADWPGED